MPKPPRYASETYAGRAKRGKHMTTVVLSAEEKALLAELSEAWGTTKSEVVGRLLRGAKAVEMAKEALKAGLEG
jgi:hypothetical protein